MGGGQAIRIPPEIAYADMEIELKIARLGDIITIFPGRNIMSEVVAELRRMPKPSQVEKRRRIGFDVRRQQRKKW